MAGDGARVSLAEGLAPDGTEEVWSETPKFVQGERYLMFVREGKWHVTPAVAGTRGIFRIATVAGREMLVNDEGAVVSNLRGPRFRLGAKVARRGQDLQSLQQGVVRGVPQLAPVAQTAVASVEAAANLLAIVSDRAAKVRAENRGQRESGVVYREPAPIQLDPAGSAR